MNRTRSSRVQAGFTMIEVLVTLVILLIGLLGLAALQSRAQVLETESYQRTQALVLLRDVAGRISANRIDAATYVTGTTTPLGQGSGVDCSPSGTPPTTTAGRDLCEWDAALKGAAEASGGACAANGTNCVGAMLGARGCITSPAANQYLVAVVWQGMAPTAAPPASVVCGQNLYGSSTGIDDTLRRAVTTVVQFGNLN
jgi:type IV pilus assembly protein PilV